MTQPAKIIALPTSEWWRRPADSPAIGLDEAIAKTHELRQATVARNIELDDFELSFYAGRLEVRNRRASLGKPFRWTLNHWSFHQAAKLVKAPADFLMRLPGEMAADALNHLYRERNAKLQVARVISDVPGYSRDEVRSITSQRYKRFHDHRLLEWLRDHNLPVTGVHLSDRGVEARVQGEDVLGPDGQPVTLSLLVGNSEVAAASLSTTAAIERSWFRIPITLAGSRVRHVGDVETKAMDKLRKSTAAFSAVDKIGLEKLLAEASAPITKSKGNWYGWLKTRGIGKRVANEILPTENQDGDVTANRWDLAVLIAARAHPIPYFDDRLKEEKKAAKVLGL